MAENYRKQASGFDLEPAHFNIPAKKLSFSGDIGSCFCLHDNLYCSVPDSGLHVFDEDSLEEKLFFPDVIDIISSTDYSIIFLGKNKSIYQYLVGSNKVESLNVESTGACFSRNQNYFGSFLIMTGKDLKDESRRPDKYFYKYLKDFSSLVWRVEAPNKMVHSFVIEEDKGVFYSIDGNATVFCYGLDKGKLLWERDISEFFTSRTSILSIHPVLINNTIVIVYPSAILAISTENGDLVWERKGLNNEWGIISNDKRLYQIALNGEMNEQALSVLDVTTGELLHSHNLSCTDEPSIMNKLMFTNPLHWTLSTTHVFVGWGNGYLTAINPNNGSIDWYADLGSDHEDAIMPEITISNNRLYCRTIRSDIDNRVSKSWVFEGEGGFGA